MWLGSRGGNSVAMKQFPKQGNSFDSSALVEVKVAKLLEKISDDVKAKENIA